MEITAKLISIGQAAEGVNKQGNPWRKATAVFETEEQYPKTVAVDFFNANLDKVTQVAIGQTCIVKFDVQSREFNGKWYTNCTGFGIEVQGQQSTQPQQPSFDTPFPPLSQPAQAIEPTSEDVDDLPF